jgi:hypothetical protein
MSQLTQTDRNQLTRYDLQDRRTRATDVSERGGKILAGFTVVLLVILGLLTYAAVQVFDGWSHLIVIADITLVFFAVAAWIYSTRPAEQAEDGPSFVPQGMRPKSRN